MVTYKMHDPEVYLVLLSVEIWTPRNLRSVAPSVECEDVTSVKCLALCCDAPRYTMHDLMEAKKIVKVTKSLYLSGASLPDNMMGYHEMWNYLANSAAESEMEQFLFVGSFDDPDAIYEVEDDRCDYQIGRLVIKAKKAGLMNIKFSQFSEFSEAVVHWLSAGREGNICEEIGFKWNSATNMQEEVEELMKMIAWREKEIPDPQFDVVIVKFRSAEWYEVWNIISYTACQMSDSYSKIPKVSDSGKAPDIGAIFWNTLMKIHKSTLWKMSLIKQK